MQVTGYWYNAKHSILERVQSNPVIVDSHHLCNIVQSDDEVAYTRCFRFTGII